MENNRKFILFRQITALATTWKKEREKENEEKKKRKQGKMEKNKGREENKQIRKE